MESPKTLISPSLPEPGVTEQETLGGADSPGPTTTEQDTLLHPAAVAARPNRAGMVNDNPAVVPIGSWELEAEAREVRGSKEFFLIIDRDPLAAVLPLGQVMGAVYPADREFVLRTLEAAAQDRQPFEIAHRVVRRDGTIRTVRTCGQVVIDPHSQSARVVGTTRDITEGRLAHVALRHSEEKFRSLVANIPDVTWSSTADGRTQYISPNIERILGFTAEEMYENGAKAWFGRIHANDSRRIAKAFEQLFAEGQPFDVEYQVQRKDGQWIWIHDRAYRTYLMNGVCYADGVFSDITARKQAEQTLTEERRLLHTLMDNLPDMIYFKDRESRFTRINKALAKMLALGDPAQAVGKADFDFFPAKQATVFHQDEEEIIRSGNTLVDKEEEVAWPDGRVAWDSTTKMALRDARGNIVGTFGISRDITERKRAEEALRESEHRYRLLFTQMLVGFALLEIVYDETGRPCDYRNLEINPAFETQTGLPRDKFLGKTIREALPDIESWWIDTYAKVAETGESTRFEQYAQPLQKWFSVTAFRTSPGRVGVTFKDITKRKQAEEQLRLAQFSIEHASSGVFWMDSQGRIVYANAAACRSLEYDREELLCLSIPDIDPSFSKEKWRAVWENLKSGSSKTLVSQHRTKHGRVFPVEVTACYLEFGGKEYSFAFARDITDRIQAEEALRQSEAKLKEALLAAQMGVWEWTRPTDAVTWDENLFRIAGRDPKLLAPSFREHSQIFAPESWERLKAAVETALAGGTPYELDLELVRPDGTKRWVIARGEPLRDAGGHIKRLRGTVQDITDRKQPKEALTLALVKSQRQEKEVTALLEAARAVLDCATFEETARAIFAICKNLFGATAGYVALLSGGGTENEVVFLDAGGIACTVDPSLPMPIRGLRAQAYRTGEAAFENNFADSPWMKLMPPGHAPLRNVMFTPLLVAGKVAGLIGLANKPGVFTDADATMSMAFGRLIAIGLDRNRNLEALRASEECFRATFENAGVGMALVDMQGHPFRSNPALRQMLGYTEEELSRMPFTEFTHPDDQELDGGLYSELKAGKRDKYEIEKRYLQKGGAVWWGLLTASIVRSKLGQPLYAVGMVQDITERKQAEMRLRKLSGAVEQSPASVVITDVKGCIEYVNPKFTQLTGYTPAEAIGQNPRFLKSGLQSDAFYRQLWETILSGSEWRGEFANKKKNGQIYWESASIVPIRDTHGAITHFLAVKEDITARKQAEEEMRKAKEAAEAANLAKSQFLANMSHEIRTPMNGVIGMAGLLLDTDLTPEQQQYAEIVRTSGEALLSVINDILDFSKIEARKFRLEVADFDLRTTLEHAVAMLVAKASEKRIELTCELERGTPCRLRGDPGRLRQVLVNLLGNAVKFTPHGEVAIKVRKQAEDERTSTLRFTVRDTGIGFRQDRALALFEPFVQGDGSSTRRYGGTGLGLAISKQLVEMMGGAIGAESREGKGSTFWFTAEFEKQLPTNTPPDDMLPGLQNAKVLVVDDNTTNRSLVCRLLSGWGCRPEGSADGRSALGALRHAAQTADPFRMALLDMSLPDMDGEELGRRIADENQLKPITLVLMTDFARPCDHTRLQESGCTGQVSKPVWERTLREALCPSDAKESGPLPPTAPAAPHSLVVRAASHARILVAEDNLTNQEVAAAMLKKLGYEADLVTNGVEVLNALHEFDYDVVLMDCEMPEMDGYEATRRIRNRVTGMRNPGIPIIAVTADAMRGDREKCLDAGMSDYLAKPLEPQQLGAVLEKWAPPPAGNKGNPAGEGSPATTEAVFNEEKLLARLMGDRKLAGHMVAGFLDDFPRQLHKLKLKLGAGDAEGARLQAHALKGAAATASAEVLRALSAEAQAAAAAGDLKHALAVLSRMERQLHRLKVALKQSGWV